MQEYITVKMLQKKLNIGQVKAYELVHVKGFPAVRVGGTIRIGAVDLEQWLKKQN